MLLRLWSGRPPNYTETQKEQKWPKVTPRVPSQRIGWFTRIENSSDSGESSWRAIKNRGCNCEWFARIALRIACATQCPEFCSESFEDIWWFVPGKRRPLKIHQKSMPLLNANSPGKFEKKKSPQNIFGEKAKRRLLKRKENASELR